MRRVPGQERQWPVLFGGIAASLGLLVASLPALAQQQNRLPPSRGQLPPDAMALDREDSLVGVYRHCDPWSRSDRQDRPAATFNRRRTTRQFRSSSNRSKAMMPPFT